MMGEPVPAASLAETNNWQTLSPIAILYFSARAIVGIASTLIYMIPILFINLDEILAQPSKIIAVIGALLTIILLFAALTFYFYRFRLGAERIEIKQGILRKAHLDISLSRIQNVKIEQPIYYRPFAYACVELDTAGSHKQEGRIVAVTLEQAEALRKKILKYKAQNDDEDSADTLAQPKDVYDNERLLNTRSLSDLVIHGVANNRVWIILGGLAPFFQSIFEAISDKLMSGGIDIAAYFSYQSLAWWQFALNLVSLTLLLMLIVVSLSIIGSIVVYYNFRLSRSETRYIRRSGLLTKQEVSLNLSRLQMLVREQDWLDGLLGRVNLRLQQNTSMGMSSSGANAQAVNRIIVPSVTKQEAQAIIDDAFESQNLSSINMQAISKRFITRNLILMVLPLSSLFIGLGWYHDSITWHTLAGAFLLLSSSLLVLRWKRWGWAYDEEFVYVRKGLFGVDYYCFPIHKIQQVQFMQSLFMRRYQRANIRFVLASGGIKVPFIPAQEAQKITDYALFKVEKDKQPWM